jgi:outer membrane biosynthesis protein TonB
MLTRRSEPLLVVLLAAGMAVAAGCSRRPDDSQLAQGIQAEIQKDAAINGQVSVQSVDGVVTLSGQVPSDAARALAAREAVDTPGVRQVVNNLTLVPALAPPEPRRARQRHAPVKPEPPPEEEAAASTPVAPEPTPPASPVAEAAPPPPAPPAEAPVPAPLPPPPAPVKHTIPAGTVISVRLIDALDSSKNQVGDTFRATLKSPIRLDGEQIVGSGADVEGRVVDATAAGRFSGHADLKLELTKLTSHGHVYPLNTEHYDSAGANRGKGTAETVGGGAVLGAIIGAVAGGGKGAAIGTVAGAGAGGATRGVMKGKGVTFPSESVLSFKLQEPLMVETMPSGDEARARQ